MLELNRRLKQRITIGDDITVKILEVRGNQVRLGICAPKDIEVHREEIYLKIKKARKQQIFNEAKKSLGNNHILKSLAKKLSPANDDNMAKCVK